MAAAVDETSSEIKAEQLAFERYKLRTERQKLAIELRSKRQELTAKTVKSWKELFANPLTLAIVGAFLTVMTTIVSNYLTSSANFQTERLRNELARESAKQTLQADLIKKFAEHPQTQSVRNNLKFLVEAGLVPEYRKGIEEYLKNNPDAAPQVAPQQAVSPTSRSPLDPLGFVIYVSRSREEQSGDRARTIGTYRVTYAGQSIAGLEGTTVESKGPGNNAIAGSGLRLETGAYPLATHQGSIFATIGYVLGETFEARPKPAIRLGETGARSVILIHPGIGFFGGSGTIVLSKKLEGPSSTVDPKDSRERVVALINAMKEKLTTGFPVTNDSRIPNAWVVISGEPVAAGTN